MCEWDQAAQCDKHRLRRFLFILFTRIWEYEISLMIFKITFICVCVCMDAQMQQGACGQHRNNFRSQLPPTMCVWY